MATIVAKDKTGVAKYSGPITTCCAFVKTASEGWIINVQYKETKQQIEWLKFCAKLGLKFSYATIGSCINIEMHPEDYAGPYQMFIAFTIIRSNSENPNYADRVLQIINIAPKIDKIIALYIGFFMSKYYSGGGRNLFSYSPVCLPLIITEEEFFKVLNTKIPSGTSVGVNATFQQNQYLLNAPTFSQTLKDIENNKIKQEITKELDSITDPREWESVLNIFRKNKMFLNPKLNKEPKVKKVKDE